MGEFKALPQAKQAKDLTGLRFGNITVVDFSHRQRTNYVTRIFWNTLCDCGNNRLVSTYHLTNKEVKSCGKCLFAEANRKAAAKKLPTGEASFNRAYSTYSNNAKLRGLGFELTKEFFRTLTVGNCHYCNAPPAERGGKASNGKYVMNGVDRMDNNIHYTPGNVVACCEKCNTAKMDMGYEQFLEHVQKMYNHLFGSTK